MLRLQLGQPGNETLRAPAHQQYRQEKNGQHSASIVLKRFKRRCEINDELMTNGSATLKRYNVEAPRHNNAEARMTNDE